MPRPSFAIVNDDLVPIDQARISVLDRGFLFADAIYEVVAVLEGGLVDFSSHLKRLENSAAQIRLRLDRDSSQIREAMKRLVDKESLVEGMVYLQVSRGAAPQRGFGFPAIDAVPTWVMFVQDVALVDNPNAKKGVSAITIPDIRWRRRDIKSTALLPQVLGKQSALDADAFEAWMIEDGFVTEGTSSSASIVVADRTIVTRPVSNDILDSITRRAVHRLANEMSLSVEERRFTVEEAYGASEAFVASATALIMPIVELDGRKIGDGRPGEITKRLRQTYLELALRGAVADESPDDDGA